MTATDTMTEPDTTNSIDPWDAQFAALKARFPKAKDSIVFCIHALQTTPGIALDDLKAQAALHGLRVTGASVTAARRLLAPAAAPGDAAADAPVEPTSRRTRQRRPAAAPMDPEAMIREVAEKIRRHGDAEAERLRAAITKAVELLTAAVAR